MSRIIPAFLAAVLGLSLLSAPAPLPTTEPAADFTAAAVSEAHPYSTPMWYPLRESAMNEWIRLDKPAGRWSSTIGCTWGNVGCRAGEPGEHDGKDYHPFFALDFNADKGDPVYAMGAGIFHVGDTSAPCVGEDEISTRGIWGWIDHGGGTTSRYHHLDSIVTALNGQLVDPTTQIGTVGISGSKCTATINYLHVGVTRNGPAGVHTNPGSLRACQTGKSLMYPRDIRDKDDNWVGAAGFTSWKQPEYRNDAFPWGDDSCIPGTPATPNIVARPGARRGNEFASLSWADPSRAAGAVVIQMQIWAPSINDWAATTSYRQLPGTARSYKWTNLVNGRTYRFRVAYRNRAGYAGWSGWREDVIPAAPPDAPRANTNYPKASPTNIWYAWRKASDNGTPVTGYLVVIRRKFGTSWGQWNATHVGPETFVKRWQGLRSNTTYGMRVLAKSAMGPSPWTRVSVITTPRR